MGENRKLRVGIGFATGRKNFRDVLKTYVYNWREGGLTDDEDVSLNLLVAYDLDYSNTTHDDFTDLEQDLLDLVDEVHFTNKERMTAELEKLVEKNVIAEREKSFFGNGYAFQRNAILYTAIKKDIDYLLFLDDDEYPMAVTKTRHTAVWSGQHVLKTHLRYIKLADITNGHHCGYISPIPHIRFNNMLTEDDFRVFIEAISNDIINWETIRSVMNNGGVTYADTFVLSTDAVREVEEINGCKFISGSNLCINLSTPRKAMPFYNPPGARGEDTFLSTCLSDCLVLKVPCYTFHDGFLTYNHMLSTGVLPTTLKRVEADSEEVVNRFYRACIGWIRYKPLLLYITQPEHYEEKISLITKQLEAVLPKICGYFQRKDFANLLSELESFHSKVREHYDGFVETKRVWKKICDYLTDRAGEGATAQGVCR